MGADGGLSAIHKDDLLHLREVVQAVRDEKDDLIPGVFLQVGKDRILCCLLYTSDAADE